VDQGRLSVVPPSVERRYTVRQEKSNAASRNEIPNAPKSTFVAVRRLYVRLCRITLVSRLLQCDTATFDDIRSIRDWPDQFSRRTRGSIVGVLVRDGVIRRVGWTTSATPLSVWALVDEHIAAAWLAANPPLLSVPSVRQLLLPPAAPITGRGGNSDG
jgi:hypothetical protein